MNHKFTDDGETADDAAPALMTSDASVEYQRDRYNSEAVKYRFHHGDPCNQKYRDRFIRSRLFNFDLSGKTVLDAMAAFGVETGYLLSQHADVTGLDISDENAAAYEELWHRPCLVRSIHDTGLAGNTFDLVYICGGLHHVVPLLGETMKEVYRILKPGGRFCFMEPNRDTWLDLARRVWYRCDKRFHETEQALSYTKMLRPYLKLGFEEETYSLGGNVAYLLIGQSLVLHLPRAIKRYLYGPAVLLEILLNPIPGVPKLFFTAVWRKMDVGGNDT